MTERCDRKHRWRGIWPTGHGQPDYPSATGRRLPDLSFRRVSRYLREEGVEPDGPLDDDHVIICLTACLTYGRGSATWAQSVFTLTSTTVLPRGHNYHRRGDGTRWWHAKDYLLVNVLARLPPGYFGVADRMASPFGLRGVVLLETCATRLKIAVVSSDDVIERGDEAAVEMVLGL